MSFEEKTLDLTSFNRFNFSGKISLRHIADWAYDYWKQGYKLSRIKLPDDQYHFLMQEIHADNRFLKKNRFEVDCIDLGMGEVEIVNADKNKVTHPVKL
jgi:hypothetical protein